MVKIRTYNWVIMLTVIVACAAFTGSAEARQHTTFPGFSEGGVLRWADHDSYVSAGGPDKAHDGEDKLAHPSQDPDHFQMSVSAGGNPNRVIFYFDLSEYHGGPVVGDGELRIHMIYDGPAWLEGFTLALHKIKSGSAGWTEETVTWNNLPGDNVGKKYDEQSPAGVEFDRQSGLLTFKVPGDQIQNWINRPENNAGMILKVNPEDLGDNPLQKRWIHSTSNWGKALDGTVDLSIAPQLFFVPEPATIGLLAMGGLALLRRRRA